MHVVFFLLCCLSSRVFAVDHHVRVSPLIRVEGDVCVDSDPACPSLVACVHGHRGVCVCVCVCGVCACVGGMRFFFMGWGMEDVAQ